MNLTKNSSKLIVSLLCNRFNGHLRKKGISGHIKISYEDETLSIEVSAVDDLINQFFHLGAWPRTILISSCYIPTFRLRCLRMHQTTLFETLEGFQVHY